MSGWTFEQNTTKNMCKPKLCDCNSLCSSGFSRYFLLCAQKQTAKRQTETPDTKLEEH